jgi:hypothetical protein
VELQVEPLREPASLKNLTVVYHVDQEDRLTHMNAAWDCFARENDGAAIVATEVIGTFLWGHVVGVEVRHIYETLMQKVRRGSQALSFCYRCDSPNMRRRMRMTIRPLPRLGHIEFYSEILNIEVRAPINLLAETNEQSRKMLSMCSWCKKIETPAGWIEVEDAVKVLGLLEIEELPRISHGICPDCLSVIPQADS